MIVNQAWGDFRCRKRFNRGELSIQILLVSRESEPVSEGKALVPYGAEYLNKIQVGVRLEEYLHEGLFYTLSASQEGRVLNASTRLV